MESPSPPAGDGSRQAGQRARLGPVRPLGAAVLLLVLLVGTIVWVGRGVRGRLADIVEVIEPASDHVYAIQRLLTLEEILEQLPPGAAGGAGRLPAERAELDRRLAELRVLVRSLDPAAVEAYTRLHTLVVSWHEVRHDTPASLGLLADALEAADHLHTRLDQLAAQRREGVFWFERLEIGLLVAMIGLALVAIAILSRIGARQRTLLTAAETHARESQAQRREVERLVAERETFLRGVTHDMKNPLGAIDAYVELILLKADPTEQEELYLERIRRSTQELLGIVNDLLELARADAGHLPFDSSWTHVGDLVREVADDYRAVLEMAGLSLELEIGADVSRVHTDPRRVREILGNLLSNARKYTPTGGRVRVRASRVAGEPGDSVVIEVTDTGPGIAEEEAERIFDEFHRVDAGTGSGAGIGLAISRRMARLLGGELSVKSAPGRGSTFTLRLPVTASRATLPQG